MGEEAEVIDLEQLHAARHKLFADVYARLEEQSARYCIKKNGWQSEKGARQRRQSAEYPVDLRSLAKTFEEYLDGAVEHERRLAFCLSHDFDRADYANDVRICLEEYEFALKARLPSFD